MSSGGALGISSSDDETLTIWNTSDGAIRAWIHYYYYYLSLIIVNEPSQVLQGLS